MSDEFRRAIEESGGHWSTREMLALADALVAIEQRLKRIEERLDGPDGPNGWLQFRKFRQSHPQAEHPPGPPPSKPPRQKIYTRIEDDGFFRDPVWECVVCGWTTQQHQCPDTCPKCGYNPGFRKRPEASGL